MGKMSNLAFDRDEEYRRNEEEGSNGEEDQEQDEGEIGFDNELFDQFKIEHNNYLKNKSRDWVNSLSGGYDE